MRAWVKFPENQDCGDCQLCCKLPHINKTYLKDNIENQILLERKNVLIEENKNSEENNISKIVSEII